MKHIQNPVHYPKFRHIQAYSHHIETYAAILRTLLILHIKNFTILRILIYLASVTHSRPVYFGIFWHIQSYSIITVIIPLTFFLHFDLKYFSSKFEKTCF